MITTQFPTITQKHIITGRSVLLLCFCGQAFDIVPVVVDFTDEEELYSGEVYTKGVAALEHMGYKVSFYLDVEGQFDEFMTKIEQLKKQFSNYNWNV